MFTLAELEDVIPLVRAGVPPTPQYVWPLLKAHIGASMTCIFDHYRSVDDDIRAMPGLVLRRGADGRIE